MYYTPMSDHAALLKASGKNPEEIASHIVDYQEESGYHVADYENFDLIYSLNGKWFVYKNRNPKMFHRYRITSMTTLAGIMAWRKKNFGNWGS